MPDHHYPTPGVYIDPSPSDSFKISGVAASAPVFVGYTLRAQYQKKDCHFAPIAIESVQEYVAYFGWSRTHHYCWPQCYLEEVPSVVGSNDFLQIGLAHYLLHIDYDTVYYMEQLVSSYFANGGEKAYIVSVGNFLQPKPQTYPYHFQRRNTHIHLDDLVKGFQAVRSVTEPLFYCCPDATLLSAQENGKLMRTMLIHQHQAEKGMVLFDVKDDSQFSSDDFGAAATVFRQEVGNLSLANAAAYYPFIRTGFYQPNDITYLHFFGGAFETLADLLFMDQGASSHLETTIAKIRADKENENVTSYHQELQRYSPLYRALLLLVLQRINYEPPTGAISGLLNSMERTAGIWNTIANRSIVNANAVAVTLSDTELSQLYLDVSGKSINVLKALPQDRIVVWGARTLDANHTDWRYLNIRRLFDYIEQSCKQSLEQLRFEANTTATWRIIETAISQFLDTLWRQGAFSGVKKEEAYSVQCGLGTSMTQDDIDNNQLRVAVLIAPIRPAEFIVLHLTQQISG